MVFLTLSALALAVSETRGLGGRLAQDLAEALDIDHSALGALVRTLQHARDSAPPLPTRLLPSSTSGNRDTDSTRLAYMRMANLLWDAGVLPLPFVPNGPELIARKRIDDILEALKPQVLQLLEQVSSPVAGCLEWGVKYSLSQFNSTCFYRLNSLVYTPNIANESFGWLQASMRAAEPRPADLDVGPRHRRGTAKFHELRLDLCRSPFNSKIQRSVIHRGGFSLVLATQVWEHLNRPVRCLVNLYSLVAAGGVVVLTVPFQYPYHQVPQDYFRYTPDALAFIVNQTGFEVVRMFGVGTRRELDSMMSGFWTSAVPPKTFMVPGNRELGVHTDTFFHSSVVLARKPLS